MPYLLMLLLTLADSLVISSYLYNHFAADPSNKERGGQRDTLYERGKLVSRIGPTMWVA